MLKNLAIDDIEVRILYQGGTVAWSAIVNDREIGEMITDSHDDAALVQRIAEAVFEERKKADDVEH